MTDLQRVYNTSMMDHFEIIYTVDGEEFHDFPVSLPHAVQMADERLKAGAEGVIFSYWADLWVTELGCSQTFVPNKRFGELIVEADKLPFLTEQALDGRRLVASVESAVYMVERYGGS